MGFGHSKSLLPPPPGPYSVGCADVMTLGAPQDGGVFMRLFYPISRVDDISSRLSECTPWIPRVEYRDGYGEFLKFRPSIHRIFYHWTIGDAYIPALWHAPLLPNASSSSSSPSSNQMPLVLFSHGMGGCRTTYSSVCYDLASRGFLVASVEHRDRSACWSYYRSSTSDSDADKGDQSVKKSGQPEEVPLHYKHNPHKANSPEEFKFRNRQVLQRASEVRGAFHLLEAINLGRSIENVQDPQFDLTQFKDRIDLSRVAVVGHSFGGATTIAALASDTDFRAGVVLDGWMLPLDNDILTSVSQPLLFINTDKFQWKKNIASMERVVGVGGGSAAQSENQQPAINEVATAQDCLPERRMLTLLGSVHQSQTDVTFLVTGLLSRLIQSRGHVDPHACMDVNNQLTDAFLNKHLGIAGKPDDIDAILNENKQYVIDGTTVDMTPPVANL